MKAFTTEEFIFFNVGGNHVNTAVGDVLTIAHMVRITWCIQKNRQNGQSITIAADSLNPEIYLVRNALALVLHAHIIGHPWDMPVCIYLNRNGEILYLTGHSIARLSEIRQSHMPGYPSRGFIKILCPFFASSMGLCLLDGAGKSPDLIKKHLQWMGDSFRMYLRDTLVIDQQHCEALNLSSKEVSCLIAQNDALPYLSTGSFSLFLILDTGFWCKSLAQDIAPTSVEEGDVPGTSLDTNNV